MLWAASTQPRCGSEMNVRESPKPSEVATEVGPEIGEVLPLSASRWQAEPGAVLAGRYRLVREVGRGGMGSVWRAQHLALGTPLAIKLIDPRLLDNEHARRRFVKEAQAAASLSSFHVVQVFDYGVEFDTPYIAMELLEGESLADRIDRSGALPPHAVGRFLAHLLRALAKAHDAGLVHRDLKPDNVFIVDTDDGEQAKVLDFGIAKAVSKTTLDASTAAGTLLGTPSYMSPEQLVDPSAVDERSDLWSVAVIAYECLVGQQPFEAETLPELAVAILSGPAPVPSEFAEVPPGFDAWFARAVHRDPDDRFQTATEMGAALREALVELAPLPIAAPVRSGPRWRWLFAGVVAVTLFAGLWVVQGQGATPEPDVSMPAASPSPAVEPASVPPPPTPGPEPVPDRAGPVAPPPEPSTPAPMEAPVDGTQDDPGSPTQADSTDESPTVAHPPKPAAHKRRHRGKRRARPTSKTGETPPPSSKPKGDTYDVSDLEH